MFKSIDEGFIISYANGVNVEVKQNNGILCNVIISNRLGDNITGQVIQNSRNDEATVNSQNLGEVMTLAKKYDPETTNSQPSLTDDRSNIINSDINITDGNTQQAVLTTADHYSKQVRWAETDNYDIRIIGNLDSKMKTTLTNIVKRIDDTLTKQGRPTKDNKVTECLTFNAQGAQCSIIPTNTGAEELLIMLLDQLYTAFHSLGVKDIQKQKV